MGKDIITDSESFSTCSNIMVSVFEGELNLVFTPPRIWIWDVAIPLLAHDKWARPSHSRTVQISVRTQHNGCDRTMVQILV